MQRDVDVTVTRDSRVSHGTLPLPVPTCPYLTSVSTSSLPVVTSNSNVQSVPRALGGIGFGGDAA